MPRRTDIHKILLIGSGPIVIGQACEFDYSGTQACKALKEEGYEIVLVNSNPATIMTDPEMADRTYVEPITPEIVERILDAERPDAVLPTLGGQTALNVAIALSESGALERYGVRMIGANEEAIRKAEDRERFKEAMTSIGLDLPRGGFAHTLEEARRVVREIGFPAIIRPSFTLGGTGGSTAYNREEFDGLAANGLEQSMISEILVEESVLGWKEYELEVMRDLNDNVVIICSIENLDPMGVHTGDSITVAPAQTLTDREYQRMRDAAIGVIREIGVETGGSNIQFALHPEDGRMVIIEMNPRVSRSSALASKATGFPIAKIAAKLAVGYTLDEIPNDITRETPSCFEPTIDYCVVKVPRFTFEKFPDADPTLTISMKSVGETMGIGRTFKEALQKALRGLEIGIDGLDDGKIDLPRLERGLSVPSAERLFYVKHALQSGMSLDRLHELSDIDPWFLGNIQEIVELEQRMAAHGDGDLPVDLLRRAKQYGFSDLQLARLAGTDELSMRTYRKQHGIESTFKLVDTCGAEFEAYTPYYYSTYETEDETRITDRRKIMILGGGPNRIGQGIEFDYCCVHAAFALREDGYETIMVNSNPETVSTDYDTCDKLYFEPLTREDVLNIVDRERPDGVIVQFGGQTPLKLAVPLQEVGVPIIGTSPDDIDRAEDRERFKTLLEKLHLFQPPNGFATTVEVAKRVARDIGYPVLVRPSYVLGGRAMRIVYDEPMLESFMSGAVEASPDHPILIDKFLEDAIEVDADAVADRSGRCVVAGVMEHIEEAGVHSGDSACAIPPYTLDHEIIARIREHTRALAAELNVIGLLNIQYALKGDDIYVLEVNPRASRTVPFVSKATGVPWAKVAARAMIGRTLSDLGIDREVEVEHTSVKEAVFPFDRFPGVDPILGPEMRSTGEVMGVDADFGTAFAKSQIAAGGALPLRGSLFLSVQNRDKRAILPIAGGFADLGFKLVATEGTAGTLRRNGVEVTPLRKVYEGQPNILDLIRNGEVDLIINTPSGKRQAMDHLSIRSVAVLHRIPYITTISGASAALSGIQAMRRRGIGVRSLQEYHRTR